MANEARARLNITRRSTANGLMSFPLYKQPSVDALDSLGIKTTPALQIFETNAYQDIEAGSFFLDRLQSKRTVAAY
jgi:hypothetical protein